MSVAIGACALIVSGSPLGAQEDVVLERPVGDGHGCVQVAALDALTAQATLPAKKGEIVRPIREPEKDLLRPMTEQEMRQLIRALQPVKLEKGEGWAIRAAVEGSELSFDRIGVLLSDAMAHLADLQSREVLDRLRGAPGISQGEFRWMERAFQALHDCGEARYQGWGEEKAFFESMKIVDTLRPELETTILEGLRRGMFSPSGHGPREPR